MSVRDLERKSEQGARAGSGKPAAEPEQRSDVRNGAEPSAPVLKITNPHPVERRALAWRAAAQAATVGIFLIMLIAALELGRPVLVPVTCAIVIGLMLGPLSARAEKYRIPPLVSAVGFW